MTDIEIAHFNSNDINTVVLDNPGASVKKTNMSTEELKENLISGSYENLEECYEAYNNYAYVIGFSTRKGKQYYYTGTKDPKTKWFYCSCEGVKNEKSSAQVAYNKFDIRTECQAKISFERGKDGIWKVSRFVPEHNHVLALPHERHFLKSHRRKTKSDGDLLESFVNSGIRPVDGISYLINESGGHQNVTFIPKDAYNYLHTLRKTKMEEGDAGALFSYFRNKKEEDPLFDWDFQYDEDGRLANIFWRDGKSLLDYEYFGDVVSFDTTYRTNKYGLKCAVFIGVNNHWKNIILGCGFLSWETTESFEWLFKTFLRSMGGKQPKTVFTDQAPAIIHAVHEQLPLTCHRLCQWHISQNAPSHIGSLNGDPQFWELLHKCYSKCDNENEFEQTWNEIRILDGHKNSWLDRLYGISRQWSTAFNNDVFSAGIKSTQRSESTNHVLNSLSDLTTSLYDFVVAFEKNILGKWRENERHDEFRCTHSQIPRASRSNPLLLQASKVYTHSLYKLFENELTSSLSYGSVEIPITQSIFNFEVFKKIKPERIRLVSIDMDTLEVRCPCKKIESMGILCRHCLRVLDMKNVTKLPETQILKRWRKDVRDSINVGNFGSSNNEKESKEADVLYSNRAMRYAYAVISKSRSHIGARSIVWNHLKNANKELNDFLKDNFSDELPAKVGPCHNGENNHQNSAPLDPRRVRPRGEKNQRKKSQLEKRRKQTVGKSDANGKGKRKKVEVEPSVAPTPSDC